MTTTDKRARLREFEREAKKLRREIRRSRPRSEPRAPGKTKADEKTEAKARLARLAEIRVALHVETGGRCVVCGMGLPFTRMHAHHILSGPERQFEERQDTMAPVHDKCHDTLHGKDNRDPLPALDALLEWCVLTDRTLAVRSTQHRIAKICEARGMTPIRVGVAGQGGQRHARALNAMGAHLSSAAPPPDPQGYEEIVRLLGVYCFERYRLTPDGWADLDAATTRSLRALRASVSGTPALLADAAALLDLWESSTNHATTRLSPSGQATKEKTRAFLDAWRAGHGGAAGEETE